MSLPTTFSAVQHRRADDDRGAVLVVVEDRDLHALAQLALDVEALRRLDVLEVDAAEGRLERGDDVDQLVRVVLVDLDVEHVDAGELLEQHALAFHHRLGGERADVAQAEHRGAVGDHGDQVAARGVAERVRRVGDDLLAGRGDAGRIGEREVALVDAAAWSPRSRSCPASGTRGSRARRGAARRASVRSVDMVRSIAAGSVDGRIATGRTLPDRRRAAAAMASAAPSQVGRRRRIGAG